MTLRTLLVALIAGLSGPAADAQIDVKAIEKSIPPITVPTKVDDKGLQQCRRQPGKLQIGNQQIATKPL